MAKVKAKAKTKAKINYKYLFMGILAFLVAAVIFCGVGSSWFTNADIGTWFNNWWHKEVTTPDMSQYNDGSGLIVSVPDADESAPIKLEVTAYAGMPAGNENKTQTARAVATATSTGTAATTGYYDIRATILPATATNMSLNIEVEWSSDESEWSLGKDVNEYVTINDLASGGNTRDFRIICNKAFGEPIFVNVYAASDRTISANCRCDYLKKILNPTLELYGGPNDVTSKKEQIYVDGDEIWYGIDYTLSEGTLEGEFTLNTEVTFTYLHDWEENAYFQNFLQIVGTDNIEAEYQKSYICWYWDECTVGNYTDCYGNPHMTGELNYNKFLTFYTPNFIISSEADNYLRAAWYSDCISDDTDFAITVSYTYTYELSGNWLTGNRKIEFSDTITREYKANVNDFAQAVEDLELDQDKVIF